MALRAMYLPPPPTREPGDTPYPFETLRYWYVTPFGGRSPELGPDQVGINRVALERNTDLIPHEDRVTVGVLAQAHTRPLFMQRFFEVVALDDERPEALALSPKGQAVLPADEWEFIRRPYLQPTAGQTLVLNGSASKLLGPDNREVILRAVLKVLGQGRGD